MKGGACRQDAWRNVAAQPSPHAKDLHQGSNREENGPPSRTRAKIKRKHRDTPLDDSDSSKTKQVSPHIHRLFCTSITVHLEKLQFQFSPGSFNTCSSEFMITSCSVGSVL